MVAPRASGAQQEHAPRWCRSKLADARTCGPVNRRLTRVSRGVHRGHERGVWVRCLGTCGRVPVRARRTGASREGTNLSLSTCGWGVVWDTLAGPPRSPRRPSEPVPTRALVPPASDGASGGVPLVPLSHDRLRICDESVTRVLTDRITAR